VIGPATAAKLEEHGLLADYCPEVYTTEGILAGLKKADLSGKKVLLPRADIAGQELVRGLADLGAAVDQLEVYKTVPVAAHAARIKGLLQSGDIDVVTFTSSSTVINFMAAIGTVGQTKIACIGPVTAAAATRAGLNVDILAQEQTISGLVEAIAQHYLKEDL
jgi:uroporphyrinogen III methyltransferase / synthase